MNPMQGQICLVTGANAGIGKQTAQELAQMGATVVLVARNRERGEAARAEIAAGGHSVELLLADFASPASIREGARGNSAASSSTGASRSASSPPRKAWATAGSGWR